MPVMAKRDLQAEYSRFYVAWLLLTLGIGVLIASLPNARGKNGILAALLILAAACFSPPLLLRVSRVSTGFIYGLATFVLIGLGSLAWWSPPAFAPPGLGEQAIASALLTLALGMAAYWVGYCLVRPPREVRPERPTVIAPTWVLFALFVVGLVATAILILTSRFGYVAIFAGPGDISWWQQWVQTATGLTGIAIILAAVHAFGNDSRAHRWTLSIMVLVSCGLGFLAGYKSAVLMPLAMTLFVYYFYRRRLPWKAMAAAFLLPIVLVPANLAYRGAVATHTGSPTSIGSLLGSAVDLSLGERIAGTTQWGLERFRSIDSVAQIKRLTPSPYPYLGAGSYAQIPAITLIPRVLWPGKPTENEAVLFGRTYFGAPSDSVNSYAITNIGDLYLHSGPLGVVFGMLIWGSIGGILFRWLWRRQSTSALVIYVVALFQIAQLEITFSSIITGAFRAMLLAWVVGRVLYGPMPAHRSVRSATRSRRRLRPSRAVVGNAISPTSGMD